MIRSTTAGLIGAAMMLATATSADAKECTVESPCVLKLATVAPKGTPWAKLLNLYKRKVQKATGKRVKVKVYLGGTLGDENATVRMAARGRIQGVGASTGALATLVTELNAVEAPFVFRSAKEADYVLDKYLDKPLRKLFRKRGLVVGFFNENGFRHFGVRGSTPILTPKDLRNKKMRSQEAYVHLQMWKALKASAQAIPTTEVLTALKTKAVDGFDQALLFAIAASWYKSIDHLTLSGHVYQPAIITFNRDWFDSMPPEIQKSLLEEGRKITRKGRRAVRSILPQLIDIIAGACVQVHELSPAQRKKFENATRKVRGKIASRYGSSGKKVMGLIEKGVKEYRAKYGKATPSFRKGRGALPAKCKKK